MKLKLKMFTKAKKKTFLFSRYSKDSKYYGEKNSLVFGKMEDEICCMTEKVFVGLKVRISNNITEGEHECKIAKAVKNSVAEDVVTYDNCKNFLFNATYGNHKINRIQSKSHNIGTYRIKYIIEESCKTILPSIGNLF